MAPRFKLYAWAIPAFTTGSPVDHTWVTTYDNRSDPFSSIQQVAAAKQFLWYCWGDFHPRGGTPINANGFLGESNADLAHAQCLVQPNANSRQVVAARGTIFRYGRDGVCHQLANQVLYACSNNGAQPLTVTGARGYMFSSFRYGTYGLNDAAWKDKRDSCNPRRRRPRGASEGAQMTHNTDDFETRARDVLGRQNPKLLSKLLALRTQTQRLSVRQWSKSHTPSADELNESNQEIFDRAADLLGPDKFERIFGFPPYGKINLVDPRFLEQQSSKTTGPTKGFVSAGAGSHAMPSTVTLKHLAATVAADNSLSKAQAEVILDNLVGNIVKHLKKGQRIRISGLGILQVRKRAARRGRNPATGELIQIKSSKKVAFRASKELKEAI